MVEVQVERGVPIPMRDGTVLRADIYQPPTEGPFPVLVERVPYELTQRCQANGEFYAQRGYVFVGQNTRGSFASGGQFRLGLDDAWGANRDGYDTIEWAGTQPWSNGKVGMVDGSYSGYTQYLVAPTRPPHLTALFVREGLSDVYRDFAFRGGAHTLGIRSWAFSTVLSWLKQSTRPGLEGARTRLERAVQELPSWLRHLPLKSCPPLEGLADWYLELLEHPEDGPCWWPTSPSLKFGEVDTPIFHLGGWHDAFLDSTLRCFQGVRMQGRSAACRQSQRLLIGPWVHGPAQVSQTQVGGLDFGPQAARDLNAIRLRWYDHWLKGEQNGALDGPPVSVFLMGDNRWLELESWPPAGVTYQPIHLREGSGPSAASLNNGGLTFAAPEEAERPDSFRYDPEDPIPSQPAGPQDYRTVEGRMLTYTSAVLEKDLAVVGPLMAVLYGLSSAPDTDWIVRVCDVWPDGRSIGVCSGILRARFRDTLERETLMAPGQLYRFEIALSSTAQVFKTGHRLRVQVTSSAFPTYDRNLNTGGPFGEEVRGQVAINTIFHDARRASHVLLPVLIDHA